MAFVVAVCAIKSLFLVHLRANQMKFDQNLDKPTFKFEDALRNSVEQSFDNDQVSR